MSEAESYLRGMLLGHLMTEGTVDSMDFQYMMHDIDGLFELLDGEVGELENA